MEEQKINFLYPNSPASSSLTISQQNFTPTTLDIDIGLPSFTTQRQPTLTQIYPSRKIKHVKHSFRKRSCSNSMQPYYIPFRNRQRTKSENQDNNPSGSSQENNLSMECDTNFQMDMDYNIAQQQTSNNSQFNKIKLVQLKKSKSLESLCPTKESKKEKEQNYSTMEFFDLNHQIQKLNLVHD
ncbi:hypothetical protein PVAND_012504 [Polypedilum vanderplanki]|uniref:Uncharacterized protein n=1 Tax=Polypedilum vanderplanki TaxID=319348 RepID=A0A9J6CMN9_POLVA|nr:hypothetical protein PVAND_012504 [Polypedilum vanderplanki]